MRRSTGVGRLAISLARVGLAVLCGTLAGAPLTAQQTTAHRATGLAAMGGTMLPRPPRNEPPPWPSAMQQLIPSAPPDATGWQQRAKRQPVSQDRAGGKQRRVVPFNHAFPVGALVVVNRERALYHVLLDGHAVRYPVAIGSFTEEWTGLEFITDKKAYPTWYPIPELGKESRDPVQGGDPANPLGARALYLGRTLWRIHGTPAAETIGQNVSNGCIRMLNEHVVELFDQVMLGTEVYVIDRLGDTPPSHRGRNIIE